MIPIIILQKYIYNSRCINAQIGIKLNGIEVIQKRAKPT